MTANILCANNVLEACLGELGIYFLSHTREYNLYALFLAHEAEVCKVVYTRRVNERYLTHPYNPDFWPVAECCHYFLEAVAGTEEIWAIYLVHLYTLGNGEMLEVAKLQTALFLIRINFVRDNLYISSFGHTSHEEQTSNDKSHLYGYGEVEDYGQEECYKQNCYVALGVVHKSEE